MRPSLSLCAARTPTRPTSRTKGADLRRIVITGGPGAGKTTLIERLARAGYAHIPETGRAIIREQTETGGVCLPWSDRQAYARLMFDTDMDKYDAAPREGRIAFYDRGLVDVIGYLRVEGMPVPEKYDLAARQRRYHETVFLAPFWPDIYGIDAQRRQSPQVAESTCKIMRETYRKYGYDIVDLPLADVESRLRFIESALALAPPSTQSGDPQP